MAKHNRVSPAQASYLGYVESHPGCCIMDVVRACKRNPVAGHKWIYDGVGRLIRRRLLFDLHQGTRHLLFATQEARQEWWLDNRADCHAKQQVS